MGSLCRALATILLASAHSASAAPPAPPQPALEETLRQGVRVTWSDAGRSGLSRYRLQRRERAAEGTWSAWTDVGGLVETGSFEDLGPSGKGLPPAEYAYRMQASQRAGGASDAASEWSEWSAPSDFTLPAACAGGEDPPGIEAPGSLPTVAITDLDGDGRHTGADVWLALERCSRLGGCILEALPVTYDDVAISLYGQNDTRPCTLWNTLVCEPMPPFPKGLVLQGHGSATVFRSPVWKTPYKPSPIFEFWHAPGVQLRFRNFVLDGRKREQPNPTDGVNDIATWRHKGLDVTHSFGPDHGLRYPDGCVHNLTARDFLFGGIEVDHARNWRIEYNRVQDIGCWTGLTDCPRLTIPDANPPPAWGCAGYKADGYGIEIGMYTDDTVVSENEITRVCKYALGVKGGPGGSDPIHRLGVRDNRITNVGSLGIFLAGTIDSVVERNLVDGTHMYGCRKGSAWASWGIQTIGSIRNTRVRLNTLRNLASVGIGSGGTAVGLVFSDNLLDEVCLERNAATDSAQGAVHFGQGSAGEFTLKDTSVISNHCAMSLAVGWGAKAKVTVEGGYFSNGEYAVDRLGALTVESADASRDPVVTLRGGATFDGAGGTVRKGVLAIGNAGVVVLDDSVRVEGYDQPFTSVRACLDPACRQSRAGSIVRCPKTPGSPACR